MMTPGLTVVIKTQVSVDVRVQESGVSVHTLGISTWQWACPSSCFHVVVISFHVCRGQVLASLLQRRGQVWPLPPQGRRRNTSDA